MSDLLEKLLGYIIGIMVHKREKLSKKAEKAQASFIAKLDIPNAETKKPIIIAMIGPIGSGKSTVAKELTRHILSTIIETDKIRIELRKQGEKYEYARIIAEDTATALVNSGKNVILDSDFVDSKKRASLREKARKAGVKVYFVCTYTDDIDTTIGRIITADYKNSPDDFFGGALTKWDKGEQSGGAVVKIRELLRRIPLHYRWENKGGGKWIIKNPPCKVLADIDTTDETRWKKEIAEIARKIV